MKKVDVVGTSRVGSEFVFGLGLGAARSRTAALGFAALLGIAACTDAGEADTASGSGGATSATTAPSSTASTSGSSASSGTGGASSCLPASATASYFSIQGADLCAVAVYDAAGIDLLPYGVTPTWGRHGGPLTSTIEEAGTTATLHLERWSVSGTTLMKAETTSSLTNVTDGAFFTSQLLDLPSLSAIAWSGSDFTNDGQMVLTSDTSEKQSYLATGVFGLAFVSGASSTRLLYTGLSAFGGPTDGTNGLYAADLDASGAIVGTPAAVATWGEASGPVAADSAGNVFAINTKFSDSTQEMRGFEASTIAPGSAAVDGDVVLDTTGFGTSLAAIAPKGAAPGLVVFQPQEGTGASLDVIEIPYTAAMGKVAPSAQATLLQLATADTHMTLMTDDQDRLWVGVENVTPGMGSMFFVLARP